MNNELQGCGKK